MTDPAFPPLCTLRDGMEGKRLSNLAWIGQAEANNPKSLNLPGARELSPVFAGTVHWLGKLAALSATVGDDAKVEAWIDRALAKAADATSDEAAA